MRIWVNGTFDVLHIGHIRLILHAASLGVLRVGIDTDERVRSKKGIERPFNKLDDRMEFLSAITGVDSVVSFGCGWELSPHNNMYWYPMECGGRFVANARWGL